jgi:hypothetical protein
MCGFNTTMATMAAIPMSAWAMIATMVPQSALHDQFCQC